LIDFPTQKPNVCPLCGEKWITDQFHSNPSYHWSKCVQDKLWLVEKMFRQNPNNRIPNNYGLHKVIGTAKIVWWHHPNDNMTIQNYIVWEWDTLDGGQSLYFDKPLPLDLSEKQLQIIKAFQ
jgi:hypothetical protein